jgi:hypothetical protein
LLGIEYTTAAVELQTPAIAAGVFGSKNELDPGRECQSFKQMWRSKRENSCATLLNEETTRVGPWENAIVPPISPYVERQFINTQIGRLFKIAQKVDFA